MSETKIFDPSFCFCCIPQYESASCLLPVSVAYALPMGELNLEQIIYVHKVHQIYGESILNHNLVMEKFISSNDDNDELKRQLNFNSLVLQTRNLNLGSEIDNISQSTKDYKDATTQSTDNLSGVKISDDFPTIKTSESKTQLKSSYLDAAKLSSSTLAKSEIGSLDWSDSVNEECELKDKQKRNSQTQSNQIKTEDKPRSDQKLDENHLIEDLLMIIKTGFNVRSFPGSTIKFNKLCDSIAFETQIILTKGLKYIPTFSSELNGDIALSKELAARHTLSEMESWCYGDPNNRGISCILNSRDFVNNLKSHKDETLGAACIRCFNNIIMEENSIFFKNRNIIESIRFQLEKEGYLEAYSWIYKQAKSVYHTKSTPFSKEKTEQQFQITRKYVEMSKSPNIDERLYDHINKQLDSIVKNTLKKSSIELSTIGNSTKTEDYIKFISSEFFKKNKGWINENSFTNASHLTKAQKLSNFEVPQSEAFKIFKILKQIIDEFRASYKLEYSTSAKSSAQ